MIGENQILILIAGTQCYGGVADEKDCCSVGARCGVKEGDCDSDNDCKGDLVCGSEGQGQGNNCGPKYLKSSECCRLPGK